MPPSSYLLVLPGLPSTLVTPPPPKKKEKKGPVCDAMYSLEHGQALGGQPLKETAPAPPPEAINCGELPINILIIIFKSSLQQLSIQTVITGGRGVEQEERLSQKPCRSLILSCESAAISTTARVASQPFAVSRSMDNGLPHGFWRQHRPWTCHGGTMCHGPQHGLGGQCRPQTLTWSSAAAQVTTTIAWATPKRRIATWSPEQHGP